MARLGAFCFPGTGHLNPMMALAGRLEERGHRVIIFGIADIEDRVRAAGLEFRLIGQKDYPPGTLRRLDRQLSELRGLAIFRFTVQRLTNTARMVLRDGPEAVRKARVEALLVDEADMAGNVADYLGIPFISVALIPPLIQDSRIPPFCFHWNAGRDPLTRLRNRIGIELLSWVAGPIFYEVNAQRKRWGLGPFRRTRDALSPLAEVTQMPCALEFDVPGLPKNLHYTGPFVDPRQRPKLSFPWEQLDDSSGRRPLIYASLGTLQNGSEKLFRTIAEACAPLPVQLVLSLGGGLDRERLGALAGGPIVVDYAPQLELIQRSTVVITHAGINTALESLSEGIPMVMLPQGNDQPGVAARVAARGAGIVITRGRLNATRLRTAIEAVLEQPRYRNAARKLRDKMAEIDGLGMAADAIEQALHLRQLADVSYGT